MIKGTFAHAINSLQDEKGVRSETYDEPKGGGVILNDTGDQASNIIANTMEPKSVADVLAGRKVDSSSGHINVVLPQAVAAESKKIAPKYLVKE
jgi:hypothetical protein